MMATCRRGVPRSLPGAQGLLDHTPPSAADPGHIRPPPLSGAGGGLHSSFQASPHFKPPPCPCCPSRPAFPLPCPALWDPVRFATPRGHGSHCTSRSLLCDLLRPACTLTLPVIVTITRYLGAPGPGSAPDGSGKEQTHRGDPWKAQGRESLSHGVRRGQQPGESGGGGLQVWQGDRPPEGGSGSRQDARGQAALQGCARQVFQGPASLYASSGQIPAGPAPSLLHLLRGLPWLRLEGAGYSLACVITQYLSVGAHSTRDSQSLWPQHTWQCRAGAGGEEAQAPVSLGRGGGGEGGPGSLGPAARRRATAQLALSVPRLPPTLPAEVLPVPWDGARDLLVQRRPPRRLGAVPVGVCLPGGGVCSGRL